VDPVSELIRRGRTKGTRLIGEIAGCVLVLPPKENEIYQGEGIFASLLLNKSFQTGIPPASGPPETPPETMKAMTSELSASSGRTCSLGNTNRFPAKL